MKTPSTTSPAAGATTAPKDFFDCPIYVIPGEDPADLEAVINQYRTRLKPEGPIERFLVDTLIECDWRKRRITRAENEFLRISVKAFRDNEAPLGASYEYDVTGPNILKNFHRQLMANERSYFRALRDLRSAQQERQPAQPFEQTSPKPSVEDPQRTATVGFVSPKPFSPQPAAVPPTVNFASKNVTLPKNAPDRPPAFVG